MKNRIDLSAMTDEQIVHRELDLERALMTHQLRHRLNKLENNSLLGSTRRDIARAKTELRRRELAAGLNQGAIHDKHVGSWAPGSVAAPAEAGGGFLKSMLDGSTPAE